MEIRWKIAFFALLAIIATVFISVYILVNLPFLDQEQPNVTNEQKDVFGLPIFTIHAEKEQLNQLIDGQLQILQKNTEQIDYMIRLKDQVVFEGHVRVFGRKLEFAMFLEPKVLENGDLLLKQDSFRIGYLEVPSKQVLKFLKQSASLPEWVIVEPKEESIYLAVTQFEFKQDMKVKAKAMDLKNNQIEFDVYYMKNS